MSHRQVPEKQVRFRAVAECHLVAVLLPQNAALADGVTQTFFTPR